MWCQNNPIFPVFWWWLLSSIKHLERTDGMEIWSHAPFQLPLCITSIHHDLQEWLCKKEEWPCSLQGLMVPFFPFTSDLCSDVKTKYYFAFILDYPWGVLLKTDQWPSQVRWGCSPDLCLLNCKLWCITGQSSANDFACIKHLGCPFIKGPFTTGAYIRLQEVVVSKKGQRSKQACEKDLWLIIDW